jgi:hypothetical protein
MLSRLGMMRDDDGVMIEFGFESDRAGLHTDSHINITVCVRIF